MRKTLLAALTAGVTTAGTALAQSPAPPPTPAAGMVAPASVTWAGGEMTPVIPTNGPPSAVPGGPGCGTYETGGGCGGAADALMSACGAACNGVPPEPHRIWGRAEYLYWWQHTQTSPTLIAAVPPGVAQTPGTVPAAGTVALFPSGRRVEFGGASGVRGTVGTTLPGECWGFDLTGFVLEKLTESAAFASGPNGLPALAQGYFSTGSGTPIVLFTSRPVQTGSGAGAAAATSYSGSLAAAYDSQSYGADANVRFRWYSLFADRNDALAGFRYFGLEEEMRTVANTTFVDGTTLAVRDRVRTTNDFYGGQLGLHSRMYAAPRIGVDMLTKLALGGMRQRVNFSGDNTYTFTDGTVDREGFGLYSRPTNTGTSTRDEFAAIFELTLNLTYKVSDHVSLVGGYNLLWVSSVVRPGEMIDPAINDSTVRFVADPPFKLAGRPRVDWSRASDFWLMGLNVGVVAQY